MITRLRQPLEAADIDRPIVAALAVADVALDGLVAAFFRQHPRLDHESFLRPDHWDVELRHAQLAASLARALQRCLADYAGLLAERIARETHDDIPF